MDKALLSRATNTDDTPTPGYLYGEIARMTQHSFETCTKVMEFLVARVKKKNHNTKYKSLQVIKHVCREGRIDFRREMQKHVHAVKECLQFRGPPDPLKGDEYYRRVRDAAKECLDAIFDSNTNPIGSMSGMAMAGRIRGVGNAMDETSQSGGWSSKLGFGKGNTAHQPPSQGYPNTYGRSAYNAPVGYDQGGQGVYGGPGGYGVQGGYGAQGGKNYGGQSYGGPGEYGNDNRGGYSGSQGYGHSMVPNIPSYDGNGRSGAPPALTNKMTGYGNPMYQDSRSGQKGFLKGLKNKFSKSNDPGQTFTAPPQGSHNPPYGWCYSTNRGPDGGAEAPGSYNPDPSYMVSHDSRYGSNSSGYGNDNGPWGRYNSRDAPDRLKEKAYDGDRKKGRVGGTWGAAPAPQRRERDSDSDDGERGQRRYPNTRDRTQSIESSHSGDHDSYGSGAGGRRSQGRGYSDRAGSNPGQTSGASSDGVYERNLIAGLCAPGGMRAVPPKEKLDLFLKSASTLDPDVVCPYLEEALQDSGWQVNSKALAVIDALVHTAGCEGFGDYFAQNPREIERLQRSDKVAVRDKALKILRQFGVREDRDYDESEPSYSQSPQKVVNRPARRQIQHQSTDLLGSFDDEPAPPQPGPSLFEGLQSQGDTRQGYQQQRHYSEAAASPSSTTDMFGGLSIGGSSDGAPPNAVPAPIPSRQNLDPLLAPLPTNGHCAGVQLPPQLGMMGGGGVGNPGTQNMQQMQMQMQMQMMSRGGMPQGPGNPNSLMMGSVMTSTRIAKTIDDPSRTDEHDAPRASNKDDSFSFVKDAMKNS